MQARAIIGKFRVMSLTSKVWAARVLLVSATGALRWGHPFFGREPARAAETATVFDANGAPLASIGVYRVRTDDHHATSWIVPEPAAGWFSVQVPGSARYAF